MKNCPRCGNPIKGFPALSREDNETEICADCGSREAMLAWLRHEIIKKRKADYPAGTRIQLISMGKDPDPIPYGSLGTVEHVDDIGTVHCKFDNGRQLGLIVGIDDFRKVN